MTKLGELAVPAAVVSSRVTVAEVERMLRDDPECPGVVTVVADVVYLLHRARLDGLLAPTAGRWRRMLLQKPLIAVLDEPATLLPYDMACDDAATARPGGLEAGPAVVEMRDGRLGLAPVGQHASV